MLKNEEKYNSLVKNAKESVLNRYSLDKFNYVMGEVLRYLQSH